MSLTVTQPALQYGSSYKLQYITLSNYMGANNHFAFMSRVIDSNGNVVPFRSYTVAQSPPARAWSLYDPSSLVDNFGNMQNSCTHNHYDGVLYRIPGDSQGTSLWGGKSRRCDSVVFPYEMYEQVLGVYDYWARRNDYWRVDYVDDQLYSIFGPIKGTIWHPGFDRYEGMVARVDAGPDHLDLEWRTSYRVSQLGSNRITVKSWSPTTLVLTDVGIHDGAFSTITRTIRENSYIELVDGLKLVFRSTPYVVATPLNYRDIPIPRSAADIGFMPICQRPAVWDYYPATRSAMESLGTLDVNNLENLKDVKDVKKLVPLNIVLGLKSGNPVKIASAISSLYLWYKYGVSNAVRDAIAIASSKVCTPNGDYCTYGGYTTKYLDTTWAYNVELLGRYAPTSMVARLRDKFRLWGLAITFENVWDMIPFSFVIDWFVPVGSLLGSVDVSLAVLTNRYNVSCCVSSRKGTRYGAVGQFGLYGTVTHTMYERNVSYIAPLSCSPSGLYDPCLSSHWSEGTALIVSRL